MKKVIAAFGFLFFTVIGRGQNVGIGTTSPHPSAQLDVSSTSKGFLPPRMTTTQRDLITTPISGLVIFNASINSLQLYNGAGWVSLISPSSTAAFLPTIVIGTQHWMRENLDVAYYRNGDPIPQVSDQTAWAGLTTGAWCYYGNDSLIGPQYGKLYNWYAVNDPRGLAPQGWHIPSDAEWTTLETILGGVSVAGGKMKQAGPFTWASPNNGSSNNSGFTALPAGSRTNDGFFSGAYFDGYWWSATENNTTSAVFRLLTTSSLAIGRSSIPKRFGFSVRCIRD